MCINAVRCLKKRHAARCIHTMEAILSVHTYFATFKAVPENYLFRHLQGGAWELPISPPSGLCLSITYFATVREVPEYYLFHHLRVVLEYYQFTTFRVVPEYYLFHHLRWCLSITYSPPSEYYFRVVPEYHLFTTSGWCLSMDNCICISHASQALNFKSFVFNWIGLTVKPICFFKILNFYFRINFQKFVCSQILFNYI